MSHIKNYLDEKLAEAEVLTTEIEARHHLATEIGGIDDPDILAGILSDPIAQLLQIRKELTTLGGRHEASQIRLPREIIITFLNAKN